MPRLTQLLFSLLQHCLKLLNQSQVLLSTGPVIEQGLKLVVLLLHKRNSVLILLDHVVELLLYLLRPLDLFVYELLQFLFVLPFTFFLSVLVLGFESKHLFVVVLEKLLDSIGKLSYLILSVHQSILCFQVRCSFGVKLLSEYFKGPLKLFVFGFGLVVGFLLIFQFIFNLPDLLLVLSLQGF